MIGNDFKAVLARIAKAPDRPSSRPADLCESCDGSGWVYVDEQNPGAGVRRCQVCLSRIRGQAPGIPQEEHGSRLDNYVSTTHNKAAIEQARFWLAGVHPDLYLFGGVGTGKTKLAATLLNERWAAGESVEFIRVPRLLSALLPGADDVNQRIDQIAKVPVVCLDDVGASQASDFARRMLLVIYEARMDAGHRTIWTSNLSLDELGAFFGDDRLSSRIVGHAKVVPMNGPDFRLRKVRK